MKTHLPTCSAKLGASDDFTKLEPLMRENCRKLDLKWENYSRVAIRILADEGCGKFVYVETEKNEVVGFLFVTYEWHDWSGDIFFWL